MSASGGEFSRRVEDAHGRLAEALGRVYAGLAGQGGERKRSEEAGAVDGTPAERLASSVSELEGLLEALRSLYEDHVHQLEREHSQFRTDSEGREQSTTRLLRDLEGENERLADSNHTLQRDLQDLQNRYRAAEASLKEKEREVGGLVEQLGAQQEDQRQDSAGRQERVREAEEKAEQLRWKVKEEERERSERERELESSRDMERSLRTALLEVRQQLEATHQELNKTQQELHSTEATLATTSEELNVLKHQLQPKEEELQALQEKIAERAQQLMELLDRRSGDYSRQVQEEIVAQSRAYDDLLRKIAGHTPNATPTSDRPLSPSHPLELATSLRDFLNPHLLPPLPPSSPPTSPRLPRDETITTAYQRYFNTFTDFTQRVRVGEFRACPKSRLRLHRLQQLRHHFMELTLRPTPPMKLDESPLCDVISLMKGVTNKLALTPNSLLVYTVDKTRIRGTTLRLWVLRQALSPTLRYEAESLLSDLSLSGHPVTFVSLAEPLGTASPMEQWEAVHKRVVGRLEETPMVDVVGGGGGGGGGDGGGEGRARSDSMDMVDLEPTKPTSQLLPTVSTSERENEEKHSNGRGSRQVGVARRAGFHIKALLRLMCTSCIPGNHGNTHYQHLEEVHSNYVT